MVIFIAKQHKINIAIPKNKATTNIRINKLNQYLNANRFLLHLINP